MVIIAFIALEARAARGKGESKTAGENGPRRRSGRQGTQLFRLPDQGAFSFTPRQAVCAPQYSPARVPCCAPNAPCSNLWPQQEANPPPAVAACSAGATGLLTKSN